MHIDRHFSSPNWDPRPKEQPIVYIILHYTEMHLDDACNKLCDPLSKVSTHYLIAKNGVIYQLVDDKMRAWHAGKSYWKGEEALNDSSIGIEMDNLGNEQFSLPQMDSCIELCRTLMNKYKIVPHNILGHSDIAPDRKIDPGIYFDWRYLAKHNIGITYDKKNLQYSEHFSCLDVQSKLHKLGYKIEVTEVWDKQTQHVIRAFQAHFCPELISSYGHAFHQSMDNKYTWDQISNAILNLLTK